MGIYTPQFDNGGGYANPNGPLEANISAAAQNLGHALFGDPSLVGLGAQRAADARLANAQAAGLEQSQAFSGKQRGTLAKMGDLFRASLQRANPDGSFRPATPQEIQQSLPDVLNALGTVSGGDAKQFGGFGRALFAATGSEDPTRMGYALAGDNLDPKFAATTQRADQLISTDAANRLKEATTTAGISAGAAIEGDRIRAAAMRDDTAAREAGEDRRLGLKQKYDTEHPGDTTVMGAAARDYVNAPGLTDEERANRQLQIASRGYAGAQVRAKSAADVEAQKAASAAEVERLRLSGARPAPINPAMARQFDTELDDQAVAGRFTLTDPARAALRARVAQIYQTNPDPVNATRQAIQEFLAANPPNKAMIGWGTPTYDTPPGYGAPAVPTPGSLFQNPSVPSGQKYQPAAPQAAPAQGVPAPQERKAGQTYPTPKGPMTWTGTGWVPAQGT